MTAGPSEFGFRLREHRLAAGLTQEELAEHAGLSARGISDLERGLKKRPYSDTVRRLADALDLDSTSRTAFAASARVQGARRPSPAADAATRRAFVGPATALIGR